MMHPAIGMNEQQKTIRLRMPMLGMSSSHMPVAVSAVLTSAMRACTSSVLPNKRPNTWTMGYACSLSTGACSTAITEGTHGADGWQHACRTLQNTSFLTTMTGATSLYTGAKRDSLSSCMPLTIRGRSHTSMNARMSEMKICSRNLVNDDKKTAVTWYFECRQFMAAQALSKESVTVQHWIR
eukprot:342273-Chlamydomonas_euryale.AAC.8